MQVAMVAVNYFKYLIYAWMKCLEPVHLFFFVLKVKVVVSIFNDYLASSFLSQKPPIFQ